MRTKRAIRAKIRKELEKDDPDLGRVTEWTVALKRRSRQRDDTPSRSVARRAAAEPSEGRDWRGLTEQERETVETWPLELKARVGEGAMSRVIVPGLREDPGGWGARNDARRRSAWRT